MGISKDKLEKWRDEVNGYQLNTRDEAETFLTVYMTVHGVATPEELLARQELVLEKLHKLAVLPEGERLYAEMINGTYTLIERIRKAIRVLRVA